MLLLWKEEEIEEHTPEDGQIHFFGVLKIWPLQIWREKDTDINKKEEDDDDAESERRDREMSGEFFPLFKVQKNEFYLTGKINTRSVHSLKEIERENRKRREVKKHGLREAKEREKETKM